MAHPARLIANVLISKGVSEGQPLTPLAILKLVYFCHGWMLARFDRRLADETFKAWTYGPVIPDLYHALKHYGAQPVTKELPLVHIARHIGDNRFAVEFREIEELDDDEEWIVSETYRTHAHYDGIALMNATHTPGGAWEKARRRRGRTNPLLRSEIRAEFRAKLDG